jgi:hypothetical protein
MTAQEQDRLAGALTEIRPHLNERQWRLLLGAQARAVGRGGIGAQEFWVRHRCSRYPPPT